MTKTVIVNTDSLIIDSDFVEKQSAGSMIVLIVDSGFGGKDHKLSI